MLRNSLFYLLYLLLFGAPLYAQKPNVIIIVSDDQGWSDVGFNGCKEIPTPHLDQLAKEGIPFNSGYVSHPYCSPSRAGLITGRYQHRYGHENNTPYNYDDPEAGLPLTEVTLAEALKGNGYKTAAIGKWHLGHAKKFWPINRGFDFWYGFYGGGMSYWGDTKKDIMNGVLRNGEPVPLEKQTYLTDDFTNETIQFIDESKSDPFFIYLAYNAPHGPWHATTEHLEKTGHIEDGQRAVYGAMVGGMDEGIGKVIDKLKEEQIYDNTLIFFVSDNGGHIHGANNFPFRGHKGMLFEGGIKVPFLVSWPDGLTQNQVYQEPVSSLDIFPTVLAATKTRHNSENILDGVNLLPYINGEDSTKPHTTLYWRYSDGAGYAIRSGNYKLIYSGYKKKHLLFDLEKDPYEKNDLSASDPAKLKELLTIYNKWNEGTVPAKWYDPHPENVTKEEARRQEIIDQSRQGENRYKKD